MPSVTTNIVLVMTHEKGLSNEDYWRRIPLIYGARLVKLCDIYDNLDPSRLCYLEPDKQDRLRLKYATAMKTLMETPEEGNYNAGR